MTVIIVLYWYVLVTYSGPLSGAYFDALLAGPFILVVVFLVFIHMQLRRFRRSRRLQLQIEAQADASS